jgi:hypothetical protein
MIAPTLCIPYKITFWCNFRKLFGTYVRQARCCIALSDKDVQRKVAGGVMDENGFPVWKPSL